jgi:DNA-binding GntR family transcriptional regulator
LVNRSLLADEVYEILRADLVSEQIAPGTRLNLDQLARELHVSNTPVRQALARLEADGLVTKEPYRGFAASPPLDLQSVEEVYDLRLLLEPVAAERAAERISTEMLAEIGRQCEAAGRLLAEPSPGMEDELGVLDNHFHLAVAQGGGSLLLGDTVTAIIQRGSRFPLYRLTGAAEHAWAEHAAVSAAILARDPDAAGAAMRTHLENALDRFRNAKKP